MASYRVVFKPSVQRDLRALPKAVVARVMKRIDVLKDDPLPRQSVKLTGAEQLYRIRVGDYRIVYGLDAEAGQITVHYIRHRREAYRRR